MDIKRKSLTLLLAAVLVLQTGTFAAYGASSEKEKQIITISNIDTSQLAGDSSGPATEIETEGLPRDSISIISEEWTGPAEYVISGSNITIKDGRYSYRLVIRSDRTLTFDNDLEIWYRGVNGRYRLHYEIDSEDDHTMIVTGVFENIIVSSPLLQKLSAEEREWILSHISEDSYFYQLVLRTKEGFSFINMLRFLFDAKKCGYSLRYSYDLLTGRQTLVICGIPDCDGSGEGADDEASEEPSGGSGSSDEPPAEQVGPVPSEQPAVQEPQASDPQPEKTDETYAGQTPDASAGSPEAETGILSCSRTVKIRYSRLRKRAQSFSIPEAVGGSCRMKGRVVYIKGSGNKKITVNKKTGKVTVKKGLKKGTYKVTVKLKPVPGEKSSGNKTGRVTLTVKIV